MANHKLTFLHLTNVISTAIVYTEKIQNHDHRKINVNVYENQATGYASQHIWCMSQTRIQ